LIGVGLDDRPAVDAEVVAVVVSEAPDATVIELRGLTATALPVRLRTAGRHNVANAVLVAAAARELGLAATEIVAGLETFDGVGRRLERKGQAGGVVVYDDYGHHPTAIRATLQAVRQREPGRPVWVAHEPLTFHRTAALLEPLAEALAEADGVAVADIWPGRDRDRTIASAEGLAAAVRRRVPDRRVAAPGDVDATAVWLADQVRPRDVVLVMGGGHSYQIADRLLELLAGR
jgi:UDP-N-acetylmuramate--alanine ligase